MSKLLIILAVFLCALGNHVVLGEYDRDKAVVEFMTRAHECQKNVGANEDDVAEIIAKQPASTAEGKCLRSCIMKNYELMDANGKFVKDVVVQHAEIYTDGAADKMKIAHEIIDACVGLSVSDDHCEAASEYYKCFKEQEKSHGLESFEM